MLNTFSAMASSRSALRGSKPPGSNHAAMAVVYVLAPVRSGKSAFGVRLASQPGGTEFVDATLDLRSTCKPIAE